MIEALSNPNPVVVSVVRSQNKNPTLNAAIRELVGVDSEDIYGRSYVRAKLYMLHTLLYTQK